MLSTISIQALEYSIYNWKSCKKLFAVKILIVNIRNLQYLTSYSSYYWKQIFWLDVSKKTIFGIQLFFFKLRFLFNPPKFNVGSSSLSVFQILRCLGKYSKPPSVITEIIIPFYFHLHWKKNLKLNAYEIFSSF